MADARAPLPADGVVWLGGRAVHLIRQPGATRPVLLLGGCGVPSYQWDDVVELLPDAAVVRLDRPGLLGTPWPGIVPTLAAEVATLADLGRALGEPMVVVAHSMAGLHVEALTRQQPELVAGVVLIDGSVEWSPSPASGGHGWLIVARAVRRAMRMAPLRALGPMAQRVLVAHQSDRRLTDTDGREAGIFASPEAVASVIAEQGAYRTQIADLARLRAAMPWPDRPVAVLTASGDGGQRWVDDQARLATLLGGRQVVLEDARHLVMLDRPDAVVEAIRAVLREDERHG